MKTYKSVEAWRKEAESLFGADTKQWKFECPRCHTVQTPQDFLDAGVSPDDMQGYIAYSCIGRFTKEKGCDWTLGGFFQLHKVEIVTENGKRPCFEFALKDNNNLK